MLQQMSSSPSAQLGEVATLARHIEGRLYGDASSEASSDTAEDFELPQCKIKRNYSCTKCKFYTQNPRAYLVHTRDVHFEKIKIYDCPHCVYASRHQQKLTRHIKMVHEAASSSKDHDVPRTATIIETHEPIERMEDLLEEVEDCDDPAMDVDDSYEESQERLADGEGLNDSSSNLSKDKNNFYSCGKCNYVTHIRARYTKHVKYHSMPMIKCTMCDFRTPYKWNLDRHMKNHGGTGSFHCSMCNFTADIRQSLTVHEMNHHTPPVGQSTANRRRNRVGASDISVEADSPEGIAFITKEEEGSGDSRSSHCASDIGMSSIQTDKEMVNCNSDSNDVMTSETIVKTETQDSVPSADHSPNNTSDELKCQKGKKIPRPIPQLIPLSASTPNQKQMQPGEPPAKKFKESTATEVTDSLTNKKKDNPSIDISLTPVNNVATKEIPIRKKNESFFDKLKERLLTETGKDGLLICKNCGFVSKCLSEHSVHEKNCTTQSSRALSNTSMPNLGSTRCQNCRHRCKSSADLYVHLKTCVKNETTQCKNVPETQNSENKDPVEKPTIKLEEEAGPHPMENVVFVWNNIQSPNKFQTPLDININDDCTLPEHRTFELDNVDDSENMNLSPSQALDKKVFKCPHCMFWASTASRFHVHIVGHLNKKPFECSLCKYKSNWRWDITKHIKLKSARDPEHADAKVLMTDETGRRNYSKYNKFLAMSVLNENGVNEFHYIDQNDATIDEDSMNDMNDSMNLPFEMQPLNLQTHPSDVQFGIDEAKKPKKTLWKCKKCNYKDPSRDALLEHVREHSKPEETEEASAQNNSNKKPENTLDPADLAYRCGHCNQLSNWKHVIQRHCRLKHDGIIKVITTVRPKPDLATTTNELFSGTCTKCPFKTSDRNILLAHIRQHQASPYAIFKCYLCPFFVKDEPELIQHLAVHGITDPEDYVSKIMDCKSPPQEHSSTSNSYLTKRHKCIECPYETNSKSQFMYHEQFHRISADTPYKCPECNYSVSKRHLLHQHMRVHGIIPKKSELESELEGSFSNSAQSDRSDSAISFDEIPYVWVSAKNEFHKMFKCRYCSYVNTQKCKIPYHEKLHCVFFVNDIKYYKCLDCKLTCEDKFRLAEHSKSHGEIYGRIYCPVDLDVPDEDQIAKLRKVIDKEQISYSDDLPKDEQVVCETREVKTLFFCHKCPARFFDESELKDHDQFHDLSFANKCKSCKFSVPEESQLSIHTPAHSDDYNTRTKMLKFVHNIHPSYRAPKLQLVHCPLTSDITWVAANPDKKIEINEQHVKRGSELAPKSTPKQYYCKECPAKFFKNSALNYHAGLHGGEGEHKCRKCSYAVKNVGNLAKHELLHENYGKTPNCDYESGDDLDYKNIPLSGTDLFQRKTEAQKRVLNDKDKLVKPNDHFPPVLQADPQFGYLMHGNPEFVYPTYLKNGRQKEKRYKCHKCPSAFEKREQYKIHLSLHGSKQRYKCELCDYSVKYYANYVQHMRKHQMNDEALAERNKSTNGYGDSEPENRENKQEDTSDNIKLAIKSMPKRPPRTDFQQFSISDQQTLRLLQRRRSMENAVKDNNNPDVTSTKDRKHHMCMLCPYTNQRLDAVCNHLNRHDERNSCRMSGNQKCSYCSLVVIQSHFLRDHLKAHFSYQKNMTPECFVANENVSFTITKVDIKESTDLKLDTSSNASKISQENKIFVKVKTGEVFVE